jgi:predicted nuclease of predicted toxin-antitoxin system
MLLFDENLAVRLAAELADLYPDCAHVSERGLAGGSDRAIWRHAQEHGLVIVSKDEDFQQLSVLHGAPPWPLAWLTASTPSPLR